MRINHIEVNVILDESLYGNIRYSIGEAYQFYFNDKGKFEYITTRNSQDLTAVTKEQFKSWKSRSIVRLPVKLTAFE